MNTNTKDAILKTAYALFSEHGFSGTSIKMISQKLSISTSLIFHHFMSKENLWLEVEQFAIASQSKSALQIREDNLENFLTDILTARIKWYENSEFRKFFQWRSLEKNIFNVSRVKHAEAAFLSILNLPDYIKRLQEKNLIKKELDPQVAAALLFSNSSYAIWDYIEYYDMRDSQLSNFKNLIIQALSPILA